MTFTLRVSKKQDVLTKPCDIYQFNFSNSKYTYFSIMSHFIHIIMFPLSLGILFNCYYHALPIKQEAYGLIVYMLYYLEVVCGPKRGI